MASIIIGSARSDEKGKLVNGAAGDQKQTSSTNDTKGEVSMQSFYVHSKGWYVLRPKEEIVATKIASAMIDACNNKYIGYDQNQRLGIITQLNKYGKIANIKTNTECDCSSTVRACCIEAGFDPGNFTTANESSVLMSTGKFTKSTYTNGMILFNGDVLVTKTKGHTVVVVSGNPRVTNETTNTYPYNYSQFVVDVQKVLNTNLTGISLLSKTVTISKTKNNSHPLVLPIQKYLNSIGYSCGNPDGIAGSQFDTAIKAYQAKVVGLPSPDGELTSRGKTWGYLLGVL